MSTLTRLVILTLLIVMTACTFGEGPELLLADSEDTDAVNVDTVQDGNNSAVDSGSDNNPVGPNPIDEVDAVVLIPRVSKDAVPTIDGDTVNYSEGSVMLDGEWRNAVQTNAFGELLSIDNFMHGRKELGNNTGGHRWAALHDGDYLYLLVISDDSGEHFQDTDEPGKPWKDDSIELYIDGNYSQLQQYDGVDDFYFTVNLQSAVGVVNGSNKRNPKLWQSELSATLPSDLIFATGLRRGPRSLTRDRGRTDIYEFRIKLSELNITLNSSFGFEVQINDDDDGGTRDWKWGWSHPEGQGADNDFTKVNPSFMAEATLLE